MDHFCPTSPIPSSADTGSPQSNPASNTPAEAQPAAGPTPNDSNSPSPYAFRLRPRPSIAARIPLYKPSTGRAKGAALAAALSPTVVTSRSLYSGADHTKHTLEPAAATGDLLALPVDPASEDPPAAAIEPAATDPQSVVDVADSLLYPIMSAAADSLQSA